MDVRDDVATSDGALDEGVELLVPAVGKMQVPRGETLRLEVPSSIAGHLEDLGSEVLEDGGGVDDALALTQACMEDAAHRELQTQSTS